MAILLYNWNFTSYDDNSDVSNIIIKDSQNNLEAKVLSRGDVDNLSVTQNKEGITFNNDNRTNGGYYIDLIGLDTVNLGGNITIEMVLKNTNFNKESVYFQTIREYIDTDNNNLDDNLNIASSGFNSHSAFLKLMYKNSETKMQVRTDSQHTSTAQNNNNTNYFLKSATSGKSLDNESFHHYLVTIKYNTSNNKSIQLYINGVEEGFTTANLIKELSDAIRQFNVIGTQKNPENATYLSGTVKYLKIYQNAMTDTEVNTVYNNYNNYPYWSDINSKTESQKYTIRHTDINNYFTNNEKESFIIQGNQLGLLNNNETYTVHKFENEKEITVNNDYHYIPLSGKNNFVIFKNNTTWYKITQTSDDNTEITYKYEKSLDSGITYEESKFKKNSERIIDNNITISFGGVELGPTISSGNICFLGHVLVETDQGKIPIKNITSKNTISGIKVIGIVKVKNKDNYMILIKKNSLGKNIPNIDTYVSKNHCIYMEGLFIKAINLVNNKNIIKKIRGHDIIYNILLEEYYIMKINNIIFETLNPVNPHAKKLYEKYNIKNI